MKNKQLYLDKDYFTKGIKRKRTTIHKTYFSMLFFHKTKVTNDIKQENLFFKEKNKYRIYFSLYSYICFMLYLYFNMHIECFTF